MLPGVNIPFGNGNALAPLKTTENIVGLICNTPTGVLTWGDNYVFHSWKSAAAVGVVRGTAVGEFLWAFFAESTAYRETLQLNTAPVIWVRPIKPIIGFDALVAQADKLCDAAANKIATIFICHEPGISYTPTIVDGADGALWDALAAAQLWALDRLQTKKTPITFILKANDIVSSAAIRDLNTESANRVGIIVGDDYNTAGIIAGRVAHAPVQRNIGRVKDGPIQLQSAKIGATPIDDYPADELDELHTKQYIILRAFTDRTGYFIADDPLATDPTQDDYSTLTRRRTADKAWRIAFSTLTNELLDEVPTQAGGNIQQTYLKVLQGKVENAIAAAMTANGELSADQTDPNDRGVKCWFDPASNIGTTNIIVGTLQIRPMAYAKYINIPLSFNVQ